MATDFAKAPDFAGLDPSNKQMNTMLASDPELDSINAVLCIITRLPYDARIRIIHYITHRLIRESEQ